MKARYEAAEPVAEAIRSARAAGLSKDADLALVALGALADAGFKVVRLSARERALVEERRKRREAVDWFRARLRATEEIREARRAAEAKEGA